MIIIILCIALQIIPSQVLVEAKWRSSMNDLTRLEDEVAMIMAILDLPAMDMVKRTNPNPNPNRKNRQPKRNKPNANGGGDQEGTYPGPKFNFACITVGINFYACFNHIEDNAFDSYTVKMA